MEHWKVKRIGLHIRLTDGDKVKNENGKGTCSKV